MLISRLFSSLLCLLSAAVFSLCLLSALICCQQSAVSCVIFVAQKYFSVTGQYFLSLLQNNDSPLYLLAYMSITRDYVKEADSLYESSPNNDPAPELQAQIFRGQLPFETDLNMAELIPKRKVTIMMSSTILDTKFEQDVLLHRAFPALRRIFTSLDLEFRVMWMRWDGLTRMKNNHLLADVLIEQLQTCIAESAGNLNSLLLLLHFILCNILTTSLKLCQDPLLCPS